MSKWNGKRFSIYTSDEENVLSLVEELGTQVNHNTDNIKTKTDLYGDHKGTWQGLSKPTLSDEGMKATVEDIINNKIPSVETSLDNINTSLNTKANKDDIAKISSGTPIFVDNINKMLDTSKNYVNLSDGYVYIYNGVNFEKTDILYQSQGIADNSITPNKLQNGIELVNLYKYPDNCIEGRYINTQGEIVNGEETAYVKVPVKPLTEYSFWRKSGNYQTGKGWILLCNSAENIIQKIDGSLNINGLYNGTEYVTIKTSSESAYLCFNARLSDFDDRNEIIVVEGETIEIALGIKKIFNYSLIDTLLRNKFNKFLESFKSSGSNLYNFESDYINNKYVALDGGLLNADNWGTAKIQVDRDATYSIYLPNGNYSNDIGALAFYNGSVKVSFKLPSSDFINGQYNGIDYITFTTPNPCTHVYITCKRSGDKAFDNSKSLICIKGNSINDETLKNYLTEINGYKIKEYGGDNEDNIATNSYQHPLKGKKWVVVGDSLTEVNSRTTKNYHKYIADEIGVEVINMGVSGTGYKRNEEYGSAFYQRINKIPTDGDIITIFGSGNDLTHTLGTPTDSTTDTLCGCMNETIKKIFEIKTGVKLGIIAPCPWGPYPTHQENNKMKLYSKAMKEVCERWGVPFLDLYHSSNMRPWDENFRKAYYKRDDGNSVHPDEDGHKLLATRILSFIESL